jgi:hypothetical protein
MTRYSGGFMLDILDSHDIIDYCTTLFAFTEIPISERVKDAQQICQLSKKNTEIATSQVDCFVNVIKRAYPIARTMNELDQTLEMLSHIEDLDVLNEVASKCAIYAYRLLASKNILDESIPLCSNFLIRIAQQLPIALKSQYIQKASSVCQLYALYQVVVFADKLGNIKECSKILSQLLDVNNEKCIRELIEIGSFLSLSTEQVLIHAILYFVNLERVDRIREVIK